MIWNEKSNDCTTKIPDHIPIDLAARNMDRRICGYFSKHLIRPDYKVKICTRESFGWNDCIVRCSIA